MSRVVSLFRAGADDVLISPIAAGLKQALDRVSREAFKDMPRGKVVGFVSVKGGCGGTTIASRVAHELKRLSGEASRDVLLLELDAQLGSLRFLSGSERRYCFTDTVANLHRFDFGYWKKLMSVCAGGLDVLPNGISGAPPAVCAAYDQTLTDMLEVVRHHYRFVVTDFGRGLNFNLRSLLGGIDELFLVSTVDPLALYQAKQLILALSEGGYNHQRLRLVLNCVPKADERQRRQIEEFFAVPVALQVAECVELQEFQPSRVLVEPCTLGAACRSGALAIAGIEEPPAVNWYSLAGLRRLVARAGA